MTIRSQSTVGVIVSRFQVEKLHPGHIHLVNYVRERHEEVAIGLGVHGGVRTKFNPLTFDERKIMVQQSIRRKLNIFAVLDHPFSHDIWSTNLDKLVGDMYPGREIILYGSRGGITDLDTKGKPYTGRFKTVYVPELYGFSGTETRNGIEFPHTAAGRAAIIYDQQHRHAFMYSTSDLAIVDYATDEVIMIGKNIHSGKLTFLGGHAEKKDSNGQVVVVREGGEELTGITFGPPVFIGTKSIDDPRYVGTEDGVMTSFYRAPYVSGVPVAGDDADYVRRVKRSDLFDVTAFWHQPLCEILNNNWSDSH